MEEAEEAPPITPYDYDHILALFDRYWYHHLIFFSPPSAPAPRPPTAPSLYTQPPTPGRHRRTRSDESSSTFLPPRVQPPSLQTILSSKESGQSHLSRLETVKKRRRQQSRSSRSMTELELEELEGLRDLGFNFSDAEVEKDPRIADIVPGLRRRRSEGEVEVEVEVEVTRRPYLSEAWAVRDEEERRRVLREWSVLSEGDERDVKEQLRRWAHAVASSVR